VPALTLALGAGQPYMFAGPTPGSCQAAVVDRPDKSLAHSLWKFRSLWLDRCVPAAPGPSDERLKRWMLEGDSPLHNGRKLPAHTPRGPSNYAAGIVTVCIPGSMKSMSFHSSPLVGSNRDCVSRSPTQRPHRSRNG
jgi:hypothetical protein